MQDNQNEENAQFIWQNLHKFIEVIYNTYRKYALQMMTEMQNIDNGQKDALLRRENIKKIVIFSKIGIIQATQFNIIFTVYFIYNSLVSRFLFTSFYPLPLPVCESESLSEQSHHTPRATQSNPSPSQGSLIFNLLFNF